MRCASGVCVWVGGGYAHSRDTSRTFPVDGDVYYWFHPNVRFVRPVGCLRTASGSTSRSCVLKIWPNFYSMFGREGISPGEWSRSEEYSIDHEERPRKSA